LNELEFWEQYGLYLIRWQLSTPILAYILYRLKKYPVLVATIVANFVGGLLFFWIDRLIFTFGGG
jgi:hypothetical protein